ncbi:hypothetical protein M427DRAFT_290955 [Gonapodya prolifera JEL478]|uniref:Uncharacterized protein n=1 Tax=Gonapodya prolifera (strain JEL478) TaxID=1344416 RepID=A0A139AIS6_GONPJ|nr:hypothetical protein M427DRAFT_290955 [Gonapodya prolifera JEL478]|eukprot:KXS16464.1 hypothetical protein M427DRAFT_290955 [Gonapodya prolifera JEL478]
MEILPLLMFAALPRRADSHSADPAFSSGRGIELKSFSTTHRHHSKRLTGDCITDNLVTCGNGSAQFCMPATGAQCCTDGSMVWWCPTGAKCGQGGACSNCQQLCSGRCLT